MIYSWHDFYMKAFVLFCNFKIIFAFILFKNAYWNTLKYVEDVNLPLFEDETHCILVFIEKYLHGLI